eukprot:7864564-Alexandrium_andersonii.AAC.1
MGPMGLQHQTPHWFASDQSKRADTTRYCAQSNTTFITLINRAHTTCRVRDDRGMNAECARV